MPSNERIRERLNGLLAIDLLTGKEYLKLEPKAKTIDIANYFENITIDLMLENPQLEIIHLFLDNNPTHKKKMESLLNQQLQDLYQFKNLTQRPPTIELNYFAPYTPNDNPVEYGIRLIRQLALHHLPINTTLEQIKTLLERKIQNLTFMTKDKLDHILSYILVAGRE